MSDEKAPPSEGSPENAKAAPEAADQANEAPAQSSEARGHDSEAADPASEAPEHESEAEEKKPRFDEDGLPLDRAATIDDVRSRSGLHGKFALGCTVIVVLLIVAFWLIRASMGG